METAGTTEKCEISCNFRLFISGAFLPATNLTPASAQAQSIPTLAEAFDTSVIVPFNFQNKVFRYGQKTDITDDYKLLQKDGRVLVPIRLMGYLAEEADWNKGHWEVIWDQQKPNDVTLINSKAGKTVRLTVNSKTMYINGVAKTLDVPAQKLDGRIVLPLRATGEALAKKINWLDGLIILSNNELNLNTPETQQLKASIKAKLNDNRKVVTNQVFPLASYQSTLYYVKQDELYKKVGSQPESQVKLSGTKNFYHSKVVMNELYYPSIINGKSELHAFNLATNKDRKVCSLGKWTPNDGWLAQVKYLNEQLYVVLHSGDWTMGGETIYKVVDGELQRVGGAKAVINFDVVGDCLYLTDFRPTWNSIDNLQRINLNTGQVEVLGEAGYS